MSTQEKDDGLIVAVALRCSDTSSDLVKWFSIFLAHAVLKGHLSKK